MDEDETDEAIASIAPLDGSFEAVGDTELIEETVVSLNKNYDKLDKNNDEDQQGLPQTTKVQCDICSKIVQRRCLTRHMRTHGDQLICSHCPAKFSDRWVLMEHEARHTNPLMCDVCGNKYTSRIGLSRHLRDHASTRPIECGICHQRFNDNAHFEGHLNSKNLNYKPFKCIVCSKAFAYRQSMARHVKERQGNKSYICIERYAVFNSKRALDQHYIGKHGQKEHTCMCGKSFRWVRSSTRHNKICKTK